MNEYYLGEYQDYIGGVWQSPQSGALLEVRCPGNGAVVSRVPDSGKEEVDAAVACAKRAFEQEDWAFQPRLRSSVLYQWAQAMRQHLSPLARALSLETGKPIAEALFEVNGAIGYLEYYASAARTLFGGTTAVDKNSLSVLCREPVGVIAGITPWNYPITLLMRDLAPALATGNTIIIKPAEQTTACTFEVVKLLELVPSMPKGVVNAVSGRGAAAGNALVEHSDVDMVSFTGGVETGKKIMKTGADTMKKLSLELGGKSPNIIFADANLEKALPFAIKAIFTNAGQLCTVGSRLVIEESIADDFLARMKTEVEKLKLGFGLNEDTQMGPVISEKQLQKILGYIEDGLQTGKLVTGGRRVTGNGLDSGFFIAPTIIKNPAHDSRVVQEEIFGPVLVVETFRTEEEAVSLANSTIYGLAGAVWSKDIDKAMRVARKLRAGSAWVNCYNKLFPECETGGYKQSGVDRAGGVEGLMKYTEVKHLCVDFA